MAIKIGFSPPHPGSFLKRSVLPDLFAISHSPQRYWGLNASGNVQVVRTESASLSF